MNILIDPALKQIWEIPHAPMPGLPGAAIPGIGFVKTDPMSPFQPGIHPWYMEPLGLQLGKMLIINPELPLPAVQRMVTWVKALMIINQATLIIPHQGTAYHD